MAGAENVEKNKAVVKTAEANEIERLERMLNELRERQSKKHKFLEILQGDIETSELGQMLFDLKEITVKIYVKDETIYVEEIPTATALEKAPTSPLRARGTPVKVVFPNGETKDFSSANEAAYEISKYIIFHYQDSVSDAIASRLSRHANQRENLKRLRETLLNNYNIKVEIE
ncbi:MAG: hypothetical protein QXX03_05775 [Nitrososphaerota archaeon]